MSIFCKLPKENKRNNKNVFIFLMFTCCPHPFSFRTSLFTRPYVQTRSLQKAYLNNTSKMKKKKCLHIFFSSPDEISSLSVFLTGMISTQDEISSRQKRVNSKRHLPYIGMISFRHEISLNCFINSLKCFVYIVFA